MPNRPSKLERITNLLLVLLDTPRPLTLRQIGETVAGYPADHDALRQAFERDKRALRDGGIPVCTEQIGGNEQYGYRILPEQYYLPDLELSSEEEQALAFALTAVRLEGGLGRDLGAKLGLPGAAEPVPLATLPALPALGPLHEAVRERALVGFDYRGRRRRVEPYGLVFRAGSWYLVGLDRSTAEGGAVRTFRVDRIDGAVAAGEPGTFSRPPGLEVAAELRLAPARAAGGARRAASRRAHEGGEDAGDEDAEAEDDAEGDGATPVLVEFSPAEAAAALSAIGAESLVERRHDGSVLVACAVADEGAFARWLLGFGDSALVHEPDSVRARVVHLLEAAAAAAPARRRRDFAAVAASAGAGGAPGGRPPRPPSQLDAGTRLRRLMAVLGHLARVGEASLEELAGRFGLPVETLVAELELAACCGLPPYTPDQLLELVVEEDRVVAFGLEALKGRPRLTAEEGFAVAAAARALQRVPGADPGGPLAGALEKLEAALGEAGMVEVEIESPEMLEPLRQVAAHGEVVEILYAGRSGKVQRRAVEPHAVVVREGRWYLDAWCELAGDWRRFQVARVRGVRPLGRPVAERSAPASFAAARAFVGGGSTARAVVEADPGASAALERVAAGPSRPLGSGRVAVPVDVADRRWFGKLVLGVPGASVLEPLELADAPSDEAAAALRRYRPSGGGHPRRG